MSGGSLLERYGVGNVISNGLDQPGFGEGIVEKHVGNQAKHRGAGKGPRGA